MNATDEFDFQLDSDEDLLAIENLLTRSKTAMPEQAPDEEDDIDPGTLLDEEDHEADIHPSVKTKKKRPVDNDPVLKALVANVNWEDVANRIKAYRVVMGLSQVELASRCELDISIIRTLETGHDRKSANPVWELLAKEPISIRWMFNGEGKFDDDNADLLPSSIVHDRGAGIRRTAERLAAEEGQFSDDPLEFVMAMDAYKRLNSCPFPTWTEALEVLKALGYRKVAQATINPRKSETIKKVRN